MIYGCVVARRLNPCPSGRNYGKRKPSITSDGKDLYFTRNSYQDNYSPTKIYVAHFVKGKWSEPVDLGATINYCNYVATPFIADDSKTLFFSAERNGSLAIYMSTKGESDTSWSNPVPLPAPINGEGNSMSPSLSVDHKTFY